jgi:hypothetical protein
VFASSSGSGDVTTGSLRAFDAKGVTSCTGGPPATCAPLWSVSFAPSPYYPANQALSAPTASGADVIVGHELQGLVGFGAISTYAANTGAPAADAGPGGAGGLVVAGGHIYSEVFQVAQPIPNITLRYLAVLDAATRAKQFVATDPDGAAFSNAAVAGGVLFATAGPELAAFDAAGVTNCGTNAPPAWAGHVTAPKYCFPLWTAGAAEHYLGQPSVANGSVYVADSQGRVSAFPASGCGASVCTPAWTGQAGPAAFGSVTVTGTSVFVGSTDGKLYAFRAKGCGATTCNPTWTAVGSAGAPSVAGSVLFSAAADGHLRAFDANGCGQKTCTALRDINVGIPLRGAPAISDGRVFVTDTAGTLHAYGLQ